MSRASGARSSRFAGDISLRARARDSAEPETPVHSSLTICPGALDVRLGADDRAHRVCQKARDGLEMGSPPSGRIGTRPGAMSRDVTGMLLAWGEGDRAVESRLIAVVYQDLRRVARRRLRAERADHSLSPTALVHEVYLRLVDLRRVRWQNRAQFFAIAARLARQILVDHARARAAAKRGGPGGRVPLADDIGATAPREVDLLDLDAALRTLTTLAPRLGELVVFRFFGGMSIEEAAEALGVSSATAKRDWLRARAWLFRELRGVVNGRDAVRPRRPVNAS